MIMRNWFIFKFTENSLDGHFQNVRRDAFGF